MGLSSLDQIGTKKPGRSAGQRLSAAQLLEAIEKIRQSLRFDKSGNEEERLKCIAGILLLYQIYQDDYDRFEQIMNNHVLFGQLRLNFLAYYSGSIADLHLFDNAPDFLARIGFRGFIVEKPKYRLPPKVAMISLGLVLGLVLTATVIFPVTVLLGSLISSRFDAWVSRNTSKYTGKFMQDVFNTGLSLTSNTIGFLLSIVLSLPAIVFPPILLNKRYREFLFNQDEASDVMSSRNRGFWNTTRKLTALLVRQTLYPIYGLIAILILTVPLAVLNLLSMAAGLFIPRLRNKHPLIAFARSDLVNEGLKIPLVALPRIMMLVITPLKSLWMLTGQLLKRGLLIVLENLFDMLMIGKALTTKAHWKTGAKALLGTLSKLVVYPLYIPLFILSELKALVLGLISIAKNASYGYFDNFKLARETSLKNSWLSQLRGMYQTLSMDLQAVKGNEKIVAMRDRTLLGISDAYQKLKHTLGAVVRKARNVLIRAPEKMLLPKHLPPVDSAVETRAQSGASEIRERLSSYFRRQDPLMQPETRDESNGSFFSPPKPEPDDRPEHIKRSEH